MTQLALFTEPPPQVNVTWFELTLQYHEDWLSSATFLKLAGREDTDANRRWLRRLAEASQVALSGQRGYKHLDRATPEEIHHFVSWMESQGQKMIARAEILRRRAHARVG